MTSIALARKWRPKTFSELIGQEHVNKALTHSLLKNRLHHAYLFTGTRGIGKTSVARLLAKAMSCEQGIHAEPCLSCETCLAIEQANYIDLIEIDGASKTRIEDTRELLDNVAYLPTIGRFKIYLIDEVHMLSNHSFNALLKTLEEPPAHVKFLLATTDPHKLPLTVLSRCLQFHLKALEPKLIAHHLEHILTQEAIRYEPSALTLIAKAAAGSVRDALSLLDQVIASGFGEVKHADVRASLGMTQGEYSRRLLRSLAQGEPSELLSISAEIHTDGGYFQHVLETLLSDLHQISVHQLLGDSTLEIDPEIKALSPHFSPEATQLLYEIALKGARDLNLTPSPKLGFEMTLLRMHAFTPVHTPPVQAPSKPPTELPLTSAQPTTRIDTPMQAPHVEPPPLQAASEHVWSDIIPQLKLTGLALEAVENAELIAYNREEVILRVTNRHYALFNPTTIKKLEQRLSHYFGSAIRLHLQQEASTQHAPAQTKQVAAKKAQESARDALQVDPVFQSLQETFTAELISSSVKTTKSTD